MMTDTPRMRPGTVFCILCQGIVTYKNGDTKRFNDHMNIEHGAFHNLRYLLAGCLMNNEERNIVAEIIEEREKTDAGKVDNEKDNDEVSILDKAFPLVKGVQQESCSELISPLEPQAVFSEENFEKDVNCTLCESSFASGTNLNRHLARFHKLSKEERDIVNKSRSMSEQEKHKDTELEDEVTVQELTPPVERKCITCSLCEYSCMQERHLKIHMTMKHKGEQVPSVEVDIKPEFEEDGGSAKSNLCDLCDSNFANASNLKRHKSTQHTDIKEMKEDLNSSVLDKGGEKSLQCHLCDVSFATGYNLKRHKFTKHTEVEEEDNGDGPFKCELCDHAFTEQKGLVIHKGMKHRGMIKGDSDPKVTQDQDSSSGSTVIKDEEIIFECDLCEYSCPKESSLKIHKTMKHKEKVKFEEKLKISQSLFRKKSNMTEENDKLQCSKCDFTGTTEKELRYHRFRNHRHAHIKKHEKVEPGNETTNEVFLLEEPDNSLEVSLDLNDTLMSVDEGDASLNKSNNDAEKKEYSESKAEFLEKSDYFKAFPGNLLPWNGGEEDLSPGEGLPEGFGVKNAVTQGGRKYMYYVTPDRVFKLRSLIAVLEYMKSCGKYSQEDLRTFELKIKAKSL